MALALKYCVSKTADCKAFKITDKTGIYSVANTGGWGTPNPPVLSALEATITIERRNPDGTFTAAPNVIDCYDTLPSETDGSIIISAESAGYGTGATFEDGIYRLTYYVAGDNASVLYSATKELYYVHTCGIDCCYQQKVLEVTTCDCVCDDINKQLNNIAFYKRLLTASIQSANLSLIQQYIDMLQKLCNNCGGGCGCSSC